MDSAVINEAEDTVTGVNSPEAVGNAAIGVSCNSPDPDGQGHAEEPSEPDLELLDQPEQDIVEEECEEGGTESTEVLETSTSQEVGYYVFYGAKSIVQLLFCVHINFGSKQSLQVTYKWSSSPVNTFLGFPCRDLAVILQVVSSVCSTRELSQRCVPERGVLKPVSVNIS